MTGDQWAGIVGIAILAGMFMWFLVVLRRGGRR